jgi:hypothetical protein
MSALPEITKPLSIFGGPYYLSIAGKLVQSKDSSGWVRASCRRFPAIAGRSILRLRRQTGSCLARHSDSGRKGDRSAR